MLSGRRDSVTLRSAITARMSDLPPALFRSITWDQGIEMARHRAIAQELGIDVFFCDPHSPWQRGSNEKHEWAAELVPGSWTPFVGAYLLKERTDVLGKHVERL